MIPPYPEFIPLSLDDRTVLGGYLESYPQLASEYSFTNLFAWRHAGQYHLTRFQQGFLIRKTSHGVTSFLQPLVPDDALTAVHVCMDYLHSQGAPALLERVGENFFAMLPTNLPGIIVEEERDQFDYLYRCDELITLLGERFHAKKNLIAQFQRKYTYRFLPMTPELATRCQYFAHEWCIERRCEETEGLAQENCAVMQMLHHFSALQLQGGVLEVDGKLVAFTLAEQLNPQSLVIHVEKAKTGMTGVYQMINWEFLRHFAGDTPYVNREQDLGAPGLRKAKLSYNPTRLIKKYRLRR